MSREAQALAGLVPPVPLRMAVLLALCLTLAGCGARGFSMERIEADRSIVTGTVETTAGSGADGGLPSDRATIRNAVSSVDLEALPSTGISWANAATGSRGSISGIAEFADGGLSCRKFLVSRESYDGVGLYEGEACLSRGEWQLRKFKGF